MIKKVNRNIWIVTLMCTVSTVGMLSLYACGNPVANNSSDNRVEFYIDTVAGKGITKSIVLNNTSGDVSSITKFSSESDTPSVSWTYKKGSRPSKFLVLMYKRGASNTVYYMSLVSGDRSSKKTGIADYVNTSVSLAAETDKPVEYRTVVTEIIKGEWTINKDTGNIIVKDASLSSDVILASSELIPLIRYSERTYIERTEYKKMTAEILESALGNKAISVKDFVGETVGIPLIRMGTAFTLTSSSLGNGALISYKPSEDTSQYAAANCVGYLGKSISPQLSWATRANPQSRMYVVLAYDPVQRKPENLKTSIASPYFALWFQYNITAQTLDEGDGGQASEKGSEGNTVLPSKTKGILTQNVYSRAYNKLNSFYNNCDSDPNTFSTRVRYDGPVPAPHTGRHYIRFVVFEVDKNDMKVFKDSSSDAIIGANRADSDDPLSNGDSAAGSAVDELVRNFIDYDRTKVRTNTMNLSTDAVKYKDGDAIIYGVTVMTFPMDAPPVPL